MYTLTDIASYVLIVFRKRKMKKKNKKKKKIRMKTKKNKRTKSRKNKVHSFIILFFSSPHAITRDR
jgi:hypothetical protein